MIDTHGLEYELEWGYVPDNAEWIDLEPYAFTDSHHIYPHIYMQWLVYADSRSTIGFSDYAVRSVTWPDGSTSRFYVNTHEASPEDIKSGNPIGPGYREQPEYEEEF